jgi:transcriptional regulator with XRE-family HTH domain
VRKSVFTPKYNQFRLLLIQARKDAGVTQVELAKKLSRPQSFVSKLEGGERRIDVIEFLEIAQSLDIDVPAFLKKLSSATSSPKKHRS